jgi:hypothetical protein
MKKSDIYEVTLKILGVYLFITTAISSIHEIFTTISLMTQFQQGTGNDTVPNFKPYFIIVVSNTVLLAAVSLFLIYKTKAIVKRICSTSDFEETAKLFAEPKIIYEVALVLSGFLIILWTLPEFGYKLKNYIRAEQLKGWHTANDSKFLVVSGLQIVAGIFAIVIAKPFAHYFGNEKSKDIG